jgi:3-dehydroquinate dehydratase
VPNILCGWLVKSEDERFNVEDEVPCGELSVTTVIVRSASASVEVPVCEKHHREHNRRAAVRRRALRQNKTVTGGRG